MFFLSFFEGVTFILYRVLHVQMHFFVFRFDVKFVKKDIGKNIQKRSKSGPKIDFQRRRASKFTKNSVQASPGHPLLAPETDFDWFWGPSGVPKLTKNGTKKASKTHARKTEVRECEGSAGRMQETNFRDLPPAPQRWLKSPNQTDDLQRPGPEARRIT